MRKKEGFKSLEIQIEEKDIEILKSFATNDKRNLKNYLESVIASHIKVLYILSENK